MTSKLLSPNPNKYVAFAEDSNPEVVELCNLQEANIWLASDINLTHDASDWNKLNVPEQEYLKQILSFFAASDGLVGENLALNFIQEAQVPEVRYFYYFQCMMEAVHAKTYSQLVNTYISSKEEREKMFASIHVHPVIKKKSEWAKKWMNQETASFSERLIAFLAVEAIFFAGSFAAIFWIRDRGILSNSLGVANEYISRDETLHAEFAATLYKQYFNDLSREKIEEILLSALEIEKEFNHYALPDRLLGLNAELMDKYLESAVDTWLTTLGLPKKFNQTQPFQFMSTFGQKRKDLFFEKKSANYARQTENKTLDFSMI